MEIKNDKGQWNANFKKQMKYSLCSICRKAEATKTNSHLIPSFLLTMVSSADHSGRRDTEILYTVGNYITTAYIGRSVPLKALEDNFNDLTDERISELSRHNAARDYIFCPHCEEQLGKLLESQYSAFLFQGKTIHAEVPYFFWLSVIWRISFYDVLGEVKFKTFQEASLRNRLNGYIQAVETKIDLLHLLDNAPFRYRMLYCKGYSNEESGFQYGKYDTKTKLLSIFFGDIVLCFHFASSELPFNYTFYGLEDYLCQAPLNDGSKQEQHLNISKEVMAQAYALLIDEMQTVRLKANRQQIKDIWKLLRAQFPWMPPTPDEAFIRSAINHLYNDEDKIGDKITHLHFAHSLAHAFKDVYGIIIN